MFGFRPNIVGDLQYSNSYGASGAFTSTDASNRYDSGIGLAQITLNFSASKSDDLYAGNKLQVPALQALVCIKS